MHSLDGLNANSQPGGCEFAREPIEYREVHSSKEVPSPRTLEIIVWEDNTAQVMLFHTCSIDGTLTRVCYHKQCSRRDLLSIMNHIEQFHGEVQ